MKLTDKRFGIVYGVLLLLMVGVCVSEGWREDTILLGGIYALSLLSTWLCHRVRQGVAYGNLIVMIVYNAILAYNIRFNGQYGAGTTWWLFILLSIQSYCCFILSLSLTNQISIVDKR